MDAGIMMNVLPESNEFYIPYKTDIKEIKHLNYLKEKNIQIHSTSLIIPTFLNNSSKNKTLKYVLNGIEKSRSIKEVILLIPESDLDNYDYLDREIETNIKKVYGKFVNNRGKARNIGAQIATYDNIVFLDDDMIVPNWRYVDVLLSIVLKNEYDAAAFPRRQYFKYPGIFTEKTIDLLKIEISDNSGFETAKIFDPIKEKSPYKTIMFCFPSCFMLIKKESFFKVGGFRDDLEGWGFEDADFALKVIKKNRVLNLFNSFPPLIHLDHPVSPYKSEEHRKNYSKFKTKYNSLKLDLFCDKVIRGDNFIKKQRKSENYLHPIIAIDKMYQIGLNNDQFKKNYSNIINKRLEEGWRNSPNWIVLHGSRASGESRRDSDFDLLFLFENGIIRNFFVPFASKPEIEVEYSDLGKFEDISLRVHNYPISGPLELSKISSGKVLWGDSLEWQTWKQNTLSNACLNGSVYWMVMCLGLNLSEDKNFALFEKYKKHLICLLEDTNKKKYEMEIELLRKFDRKLLSEFIVREFSIKHPGWKEIIERGEKVFNFQIPESWRALNWLKANY